MLPAAWDLVDYMVNSHNFHLSCLGALGRKSTTPAHLGGGLGVLPVDLHMGFIALYLLVTHAFQFTFFHVQKMKIY